MYGRREIGLTEWQAARTPIERRVTDAKKQLGRLTRTTALAGQIGNATELRERWSTLAPNPAARDRRRRPRPRHRRPRPTWLQPLRPRPLHRRSGVPEPAAACGAPPASAGSRAQQPRHPRQHRPIGHLAPAAPAQRTRPRPRPGSRGERVSHPRPPSRQAAHCHPSARDECHTCDGSRPHQRRRLLDHVLDRRARRTDRPRLEPLRDLVPMQTRQDAPRPPPCPRTCRGSGQRAGPPRATPTRPADPRAA